jgi:hypothetical protein
MPIYYIYAYLRQNGTPYYIGKGSGRRAWSKVRVVSQPTDKNRIVIMENNLTEIGALALERRYIKWWGRKDDNSGILHNRSDGGDGTSGLKWTEEQKNKIRNRFISEETRKKIARSRKKNHFKMSDEHKSIMRETHSRNWIVKHKDGRIFKIKNLKQFCRENDLHHGNMSELAAGKGHRKSHKGWTCVKL